MEELRKARATDTPVCECTSCCLGVSEWLYEMVAVLSQSRNISRCRQSQLRCKVDSNNKPGSENPSKSILSSFTVLGNGSNDQSSNDQWLQVLALGAPSRTPGRGFQRSPRRLFHIFIFSALWETTVMKIAGGKLRFPIFYLMKKVPFASTKASKGCSRRISNIPPCKKKDLKRPCCCRPYIAINSDDIY